MNPRFPSQLRFWTARKQRMGDAAVGRVGEHHLEQADRITYLLETSLDGAFVRHGLDFGCGWGRFSGLLAQHCSHLWVADLFQDWVDRATAVAPNVSPVLMTDQKVKVNDHSMDVVFDIMTIQSISNDGLARQAMRDINRIAAPGARVVSLHVKRPRSPTRTAAQRATHMGLSKWTESVLTNVDEADEEYSLLIGTRV